MWTALAVPAARQHKIAANRSNKDNAKYAQTRAMEPAGHDFELDSKLEKKGFGNSSLKGLSQEM